MMPGETRKRYRVKFNGRTVTVKALADAFSVPYDSCLARYHKGCRDPWELLYGKGAGPVDFSVSPEQLSWLRETRYARKNQQYTKGKFKHVDGEWEIACDLIGIPRVFADELRKAVGM